MLHFWVTAPFIQKICAQLCIYCKCIWDLYLKLRVEVICFKLLLKTMFYCGLIIINWSTSIFSWKQPFMVSEMKQRIAEYLYKNTRTNKTFPFRESAHQSTCQLKLSLNNVHILLLLLFLHFNNTHVHINFHVTEKTHTHHYKCIIHSFIQTQKKLLSILH